MSTPITFEYPLNERFRTFMRLEYLFEQLDWFIPRPDVWSTRTAIDALLDIITITTRADVKNELTKEIDRHIASISRLTDQPGVDPDALEKVLGDLAAAGEAIQQMHGPIGQNAREDEFLKAISQRNSIPGGTCSFDLPQFHHWLTQSAEVRQERIDGWLHDIGPTMRGIELVLALVRTSAPARRLVAEGGFFQESLDPQSPAQMLRVTLDGDSALFPEISGHKTRFSLRFMRAEGRGRPVPHESDVPFRLSCCVL